MDVRVPALPELEAKPILKRCFLFGSNEVSHNRTYKDLHTYRLHEDDDVGIVDGLLAAPCVSFLGTWIQRMIWMVKISRSRI